MGGHVPWVDMSCEWHILQEDGYYWKISLTGEQVLLVGMPYRRACITGGHVLLEGIFYRRMCHIGRHDLRRTGFTGKYVLGERIVFLRCSLV